MPRRRTGPGFANQTGLDCGDWSPRRAILIGTLRAAYHVVLQRNNGHPDRYLTWGPFIELAGWSQATTCGSEVIGCKGERVSPVKGKARRGIPYITLRLV
jgi:hypothetical protein